MEKFIRKEELNSFIELASDYSDRNPDRYINLSMRLEADRKTVTAQVMDASNLRQLAFQDYIILEGENTAADAMAVLVAKMIDRKEADYE